MGFTELTLRPGEQLLMSGTANKWQTVGSKGGKLFLTNQRIVFKAHGMNIGSKLDEYFLSEIWTQGNTVRVFTSSNLVSFNITMYTKAGEKISFVVKRSQKDDWVRHITGAITAMVMATMPQTPIKVLQCPGCGIFAIVNAGVPTCCDGCGGTIVG